MRSMANSKSTISASEIGNFLYCQRSWGYQRQGIESTNVEQLAQGSRFHQMHGRQFQRANRTRLLAILLFLAAMFVWLAQLFL